MFCWFKYWGHETKGPSASSPGVHLLVLFLVGNNQLSHCTWLENVLDVHLCSMGEAAAIRSRSMMPFLDYAVAGTRKGKTAEGKVWILGAVALGSIHPESQ